LAIGLGTTLAAAQDFKFAGLVISDPWARATGTAGQAGTNYLTLENETEEGEYLVGASTEIAEVAQLHEAQITDGIARMVPVESVGLGSGMGADLAPGGLHIMLMGLTKPLVAEPVFRLQLIFEHAGPTTVDVEVRPLGG